ncbi:MAG: hypothetical protein KAS32_07475 [Candidatus Peribacteraceae bacterium]|nr:hypothetical protein [Candidatus Peribacteraceae bacterium]
MNNKDENPTRWDAGQGDGNDSVLYKHNTTDEHIKISIHAETLMSKILTISKKIKGPALVRLQKDEGGFQLPNMDWEVEEAICEITSEIMNGRQPKKKDVCFLVHQCTKNELRYICTGMLGYLDRFVSIIKTWCCIFTEPHTDDKRNFWKGMKRLKRRGITNKTNSLFYGGAAHAGL